MRERHGHDRGGTGITSFTWCSATNQFSPATWKPSFEESAAREAAVRMRSATESWNSRKPGASRHG